MTAIASLEPTVVWEHFQTLCEIPRPSKHEQAVRDYLQGWAELQGFETIVDGADNLLIRKPATAGYEHCPSVVLQGHLDMVCQANAGTEHDFFNDPIRPVLEDGWLIAKDTTLGADNGIGVALALAVLNSPDVQHGPLEVLLTVDEEAGMGGALGLQGGLLQGQYLINLDTEEWGEVCLGCAGGMDVLISDTLSYEPLPAAYQVVKLTVNGLVGGHSGMDIHLGRGNANKVLIRLLRELESQFSIRLSEFQGGTARNALAREAHAIIAFPDKVLSKVQAKLADFQDLLRFELAGVDEGVRLSLDSANVAVVLTQAEQQRILSALHAAPHGVKTMSQRVPGVVETSNNLGVIVIGEGKLFACLMVRSLLDSGSRMLADEISSLFELAGCQVIQEGAYPGWAPEPDAQIVQLFKQVYAQNFGEEAKTYVIHAGLECGIIRLQYPTMQMISFGPTILGAHAPGERVQVARVADAWRLLQALLAAMPRLR